MNINDFCLEGFCFMSNWIDKVNEKKINEIKIDRANHSKIFDTDTTEQTEARLSAHENFQDTQNNHGERQKGEELRGSGEEAVGFSALTIGLFVWGILFFIWLFLFEPYGSYMDSSDVMKASLVFAYGVAIWVAIYFVYNNKVLTTPVKNKAKDIFTEQQKKELLDYITLLKNADDEEVGLALAASTNFAYYYKLQTAVDLFEPAAALVSNPYLTVEISRSIEEAQASGNMIESAQRMVWAHTLRACNNGKLRGLGRELWGELISRGMPHAHSQRSNIEAFTGRPAELNRLGEIPRGLMPRDLEIAETPKRENSFSNQKPTIEERLKELKQLHDKQLITKDVHEKMQMEILKEQ